MKQGDRRYTIEWIQAGQPRPYADTIHEFYLIIEWVPYKKREPDEALKWEPNDMNDSIVDKTAKAIGYHWVEKGSPNDNWAAPHLASRSKVGPGKWKFKITETFTD